MSTWLQHPILELMFASLKAGIRTLLIQAYLTHSSPLKIAMERLVYILIQACILIDIQVARKTRRPTMTEARTRERIRPPKIRQKSHCTLNG